MGHMRKVPPGLNKLVIRLLLLVLLDPEPASTPLGPNEALPLYAIPSFPTKDNRGALVAR